MNKLNEENVERHILKFSVYLAWFFTIMGLVWGVLSGSQMIIFDGLYSFISVVLSSLSIYAARNVKIADDARFPLGRARMEPMVIAFKSLVIVALCVTAASRAVISLFSGGQEINALSAMTYAIVATVLCLGGLLYMLRKRKKVPTSILIKAECMQWGMDTLLSVAVLLGFSIAFVMQRMGYERFAQYIDPLMVIAASLFFVKMPFKSLVEGVKDMLGMSPDDDIYRVSKKVLEEIAKKRRFEGFSLRISRAGRQVIYKIGFVSKNSKDTRTFGELDSIRQEVESSLRALHDNPIRLGVSFMHDKRWG